MPTDTSDIFQIYYAQEQCHCTLTITEDHNTWPHKYNWCFLSSFFGGESIYFPVFSEENKIYLEQASTSTHRKCYSTVSKSIESHGLQLSNNQNYAVGDEAEVDQNRAKRTMTMETRCSKVVFPSD